MLFQAFRSGNFKEAFVMLLIEIPVILMALVLHEMAHAFVADKLGDPTGRMTGRLNLNPKNHLDPIGTICMLLFGFGWAKPVLVDTRNFKHPKRDMALTAFAGPITNVILSFIGGLIFCLIVKFTNGNLGLSVNAGVASNLIEVLTNLFYLMFYLNIYLAIFNLIPVPPLDGSRLLYSFLPDRAYFGVMKYERIISFVIMILLFTGILSGPLSTVVNFVADGIFKLCTLITGIGA